MHKMNDCTPGRFLIPTFVSVGVTLRAYVHTRDTRVDTFAQICVLQTANQKVEYGANYNKNVWAMRWRFEIALHLHHSSTVHGKFWRRVREIFISQLNMCNYAIIN